MGMKVFCQNREGLLSACQLASAAIKARDIKPILRNFKAVAADGRCTLMATDLEIGIRVDVQGLTIQEPGEAILPASRFIEILRECRVSELHIKADQDGCVVEGPGLYFEMPGEDPAQFSDWPTFTDEKYHEISAGTLREMIRRTLFAAADETARYSMTGALLELESETTRMVATDGRRLALAQGIGTTKGGHTTKGQMPVVPTKAMTLLERNLQDDDEEPVQISIRANDAQFRTSRAVLYSRLVEGRFPDYRQVMPKKQAVRIALQSAPFQAAVRQAAIMTDDEGKRVTFRFEPGKLTLEAQGATTGRSKVEMALEFDGKPMQVNLNPAYVIDMLKVLPPNSDLTVEVIDAGAPVLFKSGSDYSYLVMPLT
jgi:DNA polymerase-3 subunit beta